jgi:hypothetical protein
MVRIAYGALLLAWGLSLIPDITAFFTADGILPTFETSGATWSLIEVFPWAATTMVVLLIMASACLLVGYHSRLAAVTAFVALISLQFRNLTILNSGDGLVRIIGFFLMFAPTGAALSVDRWRRAGHRFWEFPSHAPWVLRLLQIQVSVVYLTTVWEKSRGEFWHDGTAVSYALRLDDLVRFPLPGWLTESLVVANLLTFGTLALELALGVLIWNARARPFVLGAGIVLHVFIDLTLNVGFFSFAIFVLYLAFVPAETMTSKLLAGRVRAEAALTRYRPTRRPASAERERQEP